MFDVKGLSRIARETTRSDRASGVSCARRVRAADAAFRCASRLTSMARSTLPFALETLEQRQLFVASFDLTDLTDLRNDPRYVDIDGSDVTVAVLDSGVYSAHPDLQSNVIGFYNAVADPASTPFSPNSVGGAFDLDGHGSHTAGIAASSNPDIGVAYASKIVSVKVLASPGEKQLGGSPLVRGLQWVKRNALDLGIRVVNMSVGTATNVNSINSTLEKSEISRLTNELEALGITVVASAGNSYAQYIEPGATSIAAVSTISVGNVWSTTGRPEDFNTPRGGSGDQFLAIEESAVPDRVAATSQRSTLGNQLVAPGQDVLSTWNGFSGDGSDGLYKIVSGTSMAAPFVSGLVALMQDAAFTFGGQYLSDPSQILSILQSTADTIRDTDVADNSRYNTVTGDLSALPETGLFFKRVNAQAAIERVIEIVTAGNPAPGQPGTVTDVNAVRGGATIVPQLNATRSFNYLGRVGSDGLIDIGNDDIDLFRVSLQTRGNLIVNLSRPTGGQAFAGTVRIFNAAGTEVASAAGTTAAYPTVETDPFSPLSTGVYYIGVSALPNAAYNIVNGSGAVAGTAAGDYELSIRLNNPDPNGVVQGATDVDLTNPDEAIDDPFAAGRTVTVTRQKGLLGSDRPTFGTADRVAVEADVDMYRVVAPDNGKLEIDIDALSRYGPDAADTYVKVYNESLELLAENDDDPFSTDSHISLNVGRSQVYYVAVTVFGNRSFDASDPYASRTPNSTPADLKYDLLMWLNNGDTNGTALSATTVTPGQSVGGQIGSDTGSVGSGVSPSKDVDWFRLVAPQDGLLEFDLTPTGSFAPSLTLWSLDAAANQIERLDDAALGIAPTATKLAVRVSAGQEIYAAVTGLLNTEFNWFAVASGVGGGLGSYTLATELKSPETAKVLTNDSVNDNTPTPLTIGPAITEAIGRDGDVIVGAADIDLFSFTPESDVSVVVRTVAGSEDDADTFLRVFDSAGRQIAVNDNAIADGKASRLIVKLVGGQTYFIGVNGAGPDASAYNPLTGAEAAVGSTGRYSLVLEALPPGSASLTFGGKTVGTYTDINGQTVTLKIAGPGEGSLQIDGENPLESFILTLTNTTAATRLIVKGTTTFGDVRIDGPLKLFNAAGVTLAGELNVGGSLGAVSLAAAASGSDLSATLIQSIKIAGDFGANLAISGDLGTFVAKNDITAGTWSVGGGAKSIVAADALAAWSATFGGTVASIKLGTFAGTLSAGSYNKFTVAGEVTGAQISTTNGGIKSLVAGSFSNSDLRSVGDIGKATVGSAAGSLFFAGIDPAADELPTDAADFTTDATIGKLTVKSGPFSDSAIAAKTIRSAVINGVTSDNAGDTFGIAATTIEALNVEDGPSWKKGKAPTVASPFGDFRVAFV